MISGDRADGVAGFVGFGVLIVDILVVGRFFWGGVVLFLVGELGIEIGKLWINFARVCYGIA